MTFLSVGSHFCRWLPSDPSSRKRPCLKLVVVVTRLFSSIWTLVLPQGTFTPLVHTHAGRTQGLAADARDTLMVTRKLLPPLKPKPLD
jgi:hypothetical protein